MARAYEYDDGTTPLTGAAGERYADPTSADNVARAERDSTAYSVPAGDPFGDALSEQFTQPARLEPVPVQKTLAAPPEPQAAPPQSPRRPTPPRREQPRREQRPPSRPAPPPQRQQPQRQQPQRQQPLLQQPPRAPVLKQSKPPPVSRLTIDELTKRPPLGKQQPPTRTRSRQTRGASMARFPTNSGRAAPHPAEAPVPPRRAKNIRPIWPIIIFLVILVAMVRGCVDSTHSNGSIAPTQSVTTVVR
jgi:hypothetical protein